MVQSECSQYSARPAAYDRGTSDKGHSKERTLSTDNSGNALKEDNLSIVHYLDIPLCKTNLCYMW